MSPRRAATTASVCSSSSTTKPGSSTTSASTSGTSCSPTMASTGCRSRATSRTASTTPRSSTRTSCCSRSGSSGSRARARSRSTSRACASTSCSDRRSRRRRRRAQLCHADSVRLRRIARPIRSWCSRVSSAACMSSSRTGVLRMRLKKVDLIILRRGAAVDPAVSVTTAAPRLSRLRRRVLSRERAARCADA